jgi:hypothetical protein
MLYTLSGQMYKYEHGLSGAEQARVMPSVW